MARSAAGWGPCSGQDSSAARLLFCGAARVTGYSAENDPVSVPDFHATMPHLLGIDHKRLTVKYLNVDARLTGIAVQVVEDVLA